MSGIASKNLYDLLGNDPEQDSDREPEPPTKAIEKTAPRTGKRNAAGDAPARAPPAGAARVGRQEPASANERAFRDRTAGSANNRSHAPEEGTRPQRGGEYRGRGGSRGGRGGRGGRDDRHSKTGIADHAKQAGHGWGRETGEGELNDEKAGEAIAKAEEKDGFDTSVPPPVNADGEAYAQDPTTGPEEETEPEIQTKSYDEYLAEVAQKKLEIAGQLHVRKPNEGASKKFPEGKAFSREGEEEDFMAGTGGKNKRDREKKEKTFLDLKGVDPRQYMAPEAGAPAGRGGRGRGGRGDRGGDRGDRPDRSDRRDGGGDRGGFRGRGRGDRGRGGDRLDFRGGRGAPRGGAASAPQVDDAKAFPSLGS